jgi:hypothetical protein
VRMEQTNGFPAYRQAGKALEREVKASSPVCLFGFSELQLLFPIATRRQWKDGKGRG